MRPHVVQVLMEPGRAEVTVDRTKIVKEYDLAIAPSEEIVHPKKKGTTQYTARSFNGKTLILFEEISSLVPRLESQ
jgi:hypothetical protein